MTKERVIDAFKYLYDKFKNYKNEEIESWGIVDECITEWIALKNKDYKYRWHDLRKNPNDLPSVDGDYMCRVGARKYPERPMTYEPYDLRVDGENKWRDFEGYVYDHFIIAWREIKPFEEVEE